MRADYCTQQESVSMIVTAGLNVIGSVVVKTAVKQLHADFINAEGEVLDSFTITR